MTLPQYEKPIKTQQDLIDSKMPWGADTPAWVETIAHSSQVSVSLHYLLKIIYSNIFGLG